MAVSRTPDVPGEELGLFVPDDDNLRLEDYAVGSVISGKFRVERVIGVGSMGVVLAATHLGMDEMVALKLIRAEVQKLPGVVSRFAREAKAAVKLKSEHIAQVLDVGVSERVGPYIVMEYLEGQNLAEMLDESGPLEIRRAVDYVLQACEALAVAHAASVTHRDIKPENLFVTRQGDRELVKLLDFGISKAALTGRVFGDELSEGDGSCLLGTPLYMSPEQIRATEEVTHQTDVWSLGAVLYELVTGRSAFVADSVAQVWNRILETNPGPLAHYCPHAPAELQVVIDRCLEKDPRRRYATVADLAFALLPFAPSRGAIYAERAAAILGRASDSAYPPPLPSSPATRRTLQRRSSSGVLVLPDRGSSPASSRKSWSVPARPARSRLAAFALGAGLLLAITGSIVLPRQRLRALSEQSAAAARAPAAPSSAVTPTPAAGEAPSAEAPVTEAPATGVSDMPVSDVAVSDVAVSDVAAPLPSGGVAPGAVPEWVLVPVEEPSDALGAPEAPPKPPVAASASAPSAAPTARSTAKSRADKARLAKARAKRAMEEAPSAPATTNAPRSAEGARVAPEPPKAAAPARLVEDEGRVRLVPDEPRTELLD